MSQVQDTLKEVAPELAAIAEKLMFAGLKDLVAQLPVTVQPLVIGIEAALEPAIKQYLDAKLAELMA